MNSAQNINIENGTPELMKNAARIFLERLSDRKCILEIPLILKVDRNLPDEGFRIASVYKQGVKTLNDDVIGHKLIDCGIQVSGANESGVLYGLGKLLRNGSFKDGRFRPGSWRGVSSPAKPYRIVYLAPHFYNYYQCAPLDELKKYLEDLALLGFNGLKLGLPGSLFSSNDQPSKLPKVLNAEACLYFMSGGKGHSSVPDFSRLFAAGDESSGVPTLARSPVGLEDVHRAGGVGRDVGSEHERRRSVKCRQRLFQDALLHQLAVL